MGCCHVLCCALSIVPQVYFHVICVSGRVTKFKNFDAELLAFLWYVLFGNHPSFEGNKDFVNNQIFRRAVKFGKCKKIKQSLYRPRRAQGIPGSLGSQIS